MSMAMTKDGKAYKEVAQHLAKQQFSCEPLAGRLAVFIDLHPPDRRKRDIANYEKLLIDSMQGVLFENDEQIDKLVIERKEVVKQGRAIISVGEIDE